MGIKGIFHVIEDQATGAEIRFHRIGTYKVNNLNQSCSLELFGYASEEKMDAGRSPINRWEIQFPLPANSHNVNMNDYSYEVIVSPKPEVEPGTQTDEEREQFNLRHAFAGANLVYYPEDAPAFEA